MLQRAISITEYTSISQFAKNDKLKQNILHSNQYSMIFKNNFYSQTSQNNSMLDAIKYEQIF